jgi:hypothetical protein
MAKPKHDLDALQALEGQRISKVAFQGDASNTVYLINLTLDDGSMLEIKAAFGYPLDLKRCQIAIDCTQG